LEQKKIGRDVGVTVVPNVCAAILFDLKCGRHDIRPDEKMGFAACENAFSGQKWKSGNYGAGSGATVGNICGNDRAMKGGIGSFAFQYNGLYAGAIVAVNCIGDIYDNRTGKKIAGARSADGKNFVDSEIEILERFNENTDVFSANTIIGCIITNSKLTKAQAAKLSALGQNGIARAVRPAHTMFDGDTIFSMCSGEVETTLDAVGVLATRAVEYAIVDAVNNAKTIDTYIAARDF
jgi:L-aminopeptidase/D-esterase-like protein